MRRKNDAYYTPEWATEELLRNLYLSSTTSILEPCSGSGNISNVLHDRFRDVYTNDIDPNAPSFMHYDYLTQKFSQRDWVITNPPFNRALEFLEKAWQESKVGVALLLRLSFLEPTYARSYILEKMPPNRIIVLPRISFTGDGKTDSVTTAWMVWEHGNIDQSIVIIPKKEK